MTTQIQAKPSASTLTLQERLRDVNFDLEEHRDELVAEFACHEQKLQQLQEQVHALELVNSTSKHLLASLHEELREAQNRERKMRNEFTAELEVVRKNVDQEEQSSQSDLKRQICELQKRYEEECAEKNRLQQALGEFERTSMACTAAQAKDQEYLVQFKHQLENGIVVTKFGSRGVPHQRVVYSDSQCHWISWRSPATSIAHAGATTETFARQPPEAPTRCFSLVFVHPCRTLDVQADTAAQCQQYLRGFRLLREEVALKRR
ncbi:hypothetical protein BBO99_00007199 [Phytophthora kernoviae]|uniref:Uncharacterized protein n=2 Tax=Phytophthora kernoviae TaxID=325452 RepID=A0A421EUA2_9STRA|nr:hypothetical protein G195_005010 [Phytophthora kernoviae 00238/432]KAG2524749.1 hypothetical protein JM16_004810 [Phytophthora kernoviae]KAG2530086.1 hypothetical protein JM18_002529 [Phytophthora kernoviae]RLN02151.1 hypothetical protein BBI17_002330 [Phytophthora kernoviae]RLN76890.1 hypothetical protein BBO99_00007199 [Phytophthora kernoviae]